MAENTGTLQAMEDSDVQRAAVEEAEANAEWWNQEWLKFPTISLDDDGHWHYWDVPADTGVGFAPSFRFGKLDSLSTKEQRSACAALQVVPPRGKSFRQVTSPIVSVPRNEALNPLQRAVDREAGSSELPVILNKAPLQLLVTTLDYDTYRGAVAGRVLAPGFAPPGRQWRRYKPQESRLVRRRHPAR